MLEFLRRKAQSPLLQGTILVIILVFIFWGTNMGQGNRRDAAVMVNDQAITFSEFNQEYNQTMDRLREQFGGVVPKGLLEQLNMKQQVLQRLIQRTLLLQGGKELGLSVSNAEVQEKVQAQAAFQVDGKFDHEHYKQLLARNRLSPKKYEAGLRQDMLARKVTRHLAAFVTVSSWEVNDRHAFNSQELKLRYAAFPATKYKDKVEVKDEELAAWYEKNKEKYRTSPQVKLDYLLYSQDDFLPTISDEEAKKYYDHNLSQYTSQEQRRASHILLRGTDKETRDRMADILAQAREGKDFAALARKYSEDPGSARQGGDLGFFGKGQMVPAFEEAVFSLQPGEISGIIKSRFGFHIIKLTSVKPPETTPFSEVKESIIATLQEEQGKAAAFEKAGEAYEKIFQAGSLAKYTEEQGITLLHTDFFSQAEPLEGLAGGSLVSKAFALAKGELSSLLETPNGYAIIYINDRKDAEIPPLQAVQEQASQDYIADQAREMARQKAVDTLKKIKDGEEFTAAVEAGGATVQTTDFFSRRRPLRGSLPAEIGSKAFSLSVSHPLPDEPYGQADTFYIYGLLERKEDVPPLTSQEETILRARLRQEKEQRLMEDWLAFLRKKSDIRTNKKFLDRY